MASREIWKPVPTWEDHYRASSLGSIQRITTGRRLRPGLTPQGYRHVVLCIGHRRHDMTVHRIIALTFLGPRPNGLDVHHIDSDRSNNHLNNLCYTSRSQNIWQGWNTS